MAGWRGEQALEGALIGSLVSHQYVQVVAVVVLLRHPQRQHLLVQKQSAQALLAGLSLLFQLPLPEGFLLKLTLLGAFLKDGERKVQSGFRDQDHSLMLCEMVQRNETKTFLCVPSGQNGALFV